MEKKWEERRYELTKAAISGATALNWEAKSIASTAVSVADAVIAILRDGAAVTDVNGEMVERIKMRVEEMPLSNRTRNILLREGFHTLGDIAKCLRTDFCKKTNIGRKAETQIEEILVDNELYFGFNIEEAVAQKKQGF